MEESNLAIADAALDMSAQMTAFYDEFVEFQAYCSLLCDALSAMATNQMQLDEATRRGVEAFAGYLKRRLEELRTRVGQLQQTSTSWQSPGANAPDLTE